MNLNTLFTTRKNNRVTNREENLFSALYFPRDKSTEQEERFDLMMQELESLRKSVNE